MEAALIEDAAPVEDAALVGLETPCYVYRVERALACYRGLREALGTRLLASFKANPNVDFLERCGHVFEDGIEVASLGELGAVVGRLRAPRFVNTPALDSELAKAALAARCLLVIDSRSQARELLEAAPQGGGRELYLRLHADAADPAGSAAGPRDHFGMDPPDWTAAGAELEREGYRVTGLHVFGGSNSFKRRGLGVVRGLQRLLPVLEFGLGHALSHLSLGGGFPEDWHELAGELAEYRAALAPLSARYTLLHEAGRALYASAGAFVTRVAHVKHVGGRCVAVCDGGLSQSFLLCGTETPLRRWRAPRVVRATPRPTNGSAATEEVYFVGSTCNPRDVLGRARLDDPPVRGDLCVFEGCGAYHQTYSPVAFLGSKPARAYVMV